jgi:mono/diheme cytochrome c family protein
LKWLGIALAAVVGLIVVAVLAVYLLSEQQFNRRYDVQAAAVTIPSDPASVERGEHLVVAVAKCIDCHGENLAGRVLVDDPSVGRLAGSNLTKGNGGIGAQYGDADFVRAIRHGVRRDGRGIPIMPANAYYYFSDADLGAIIAYVKSVPAVDNPSAGVSAGLLFRALMAAGQVPQAVPAALINHSGARPEAPQPGVHPAYGRYLVITGGCMDCHGEGLSGGSIPGAPPGSLPAKNITPGGNLGKWSEEDFIRTLRTGTTPEGYPLNPDQMPWKAAGQMTDDEIKAVYAYLKSVPAKPDGNR